MTGGPTRCHVRLYFALNCGGSSSVGGNRYPSLTMAAASSPAPSASSASSNASSHGSRALPSVVTATRRWNLRHPVCALCCAVVRVPDTSRVCRNPNCVDVRLCHTCYAQGHVCDPCDGKTAHLCCMHPVPASSLCACGVFRCRTEGCNYAGVCFACFTVICSSACLAHCDECEPDLQYHTRCLSGPRRRCLEHAVH